MPRGWPNLWLQVGLLGSFELLYALSGVYGRARATAGLANAHSVMRFEQTLGIAWEHGIQDWTLRQSPLLLDIANRTYFISQFAVSWAFVYWVYVCRSERFARVRNALLAVNLVSLLALFVYPLAPPRIVPGAGFVDTLNSSGVSLNDGLINALNNPYSAMPSLHASYAVVIGVSGVLLTRHRWAQVAWAAYPALVAYSVIATANHFVLDVAVGTVAVAATPLVDAGQRSITRWRQRSASTATTMPEVEDGVLS